MRRSQHLTVAFVLLAFVFSACQSSQEDILSKSDNACLADSIGKLKKAPSFPGCDSDIGFCESRCRAGDGEYCLSWAWALEAKGEDREKVQKIFRRACEKGFAVACTNYAASIWSRDHTESELECANSIFSKSCEAGEPFGCGMFGRSMVTASKSKDDFEKAEGFLKSKCDSLGGFPCRVLAKHYEEGDFEAESPDIKGLMKKACDGGDPDGCKAVESAAETFTER